MRRVVVLRNLRLMALQRLDRGYKTALPLKPDVRERKVAISYCVLDAVDAWGAFVRSLYVSSALGARQGNGKAISSRRAFASAQEALDFAAAWNYLRKPGARPTPPPYKRENEPAWHRPNNIRSLAAALAFSNEPTIVRALSRAGGTIDDLITARNYLAHRNQQTGRLFRDVLYRHAVTPTHSAEDSVCTLVPTRAVTLLELWLSDLRDTIDIMAR